MNYQKIEQSNGLCFDRQQLLANSFKSLVSHENKKWLVAAQNLQSNETF